jgi:hypothetical protein
MDTDGIGAVGRSRGEHSRQTALALASRPGREHIPIGVVKPREDEDRVSWLETVQGVDHLGRHHEGGTRSALVWLTRTVFDPTEWRDHFADHPKRPEAIIHRRTTCG